MKSYMIFLGIFFGLCVGIEDTVASAPSALAVEEGEQKRLVEEAVAPVIPVAGESDESGQREEDWELVETSTAGEAAPVEGPKAEEPASYWASFTGQARTLGRAAATAAQSAYTGYVAPTAQSLWGKVSSGSGVASGTPQQLQPTQKSPEEKARALCQYITGVIENYRKKDPVATGTLEENYYSWGKRLQQYQKQLGSSSSAVQEIEALLLELEKISAEYTSTETELPDLEDRPTIAEGAASSLTSASSAGAMPTGVSTGEQQPQPTQKSPGVNWEDLIGVSSLPLKEKATALCQYIMEVISKFDKNDKAATELLAKNYHPWDKQLKQYKEQLQASGDSATALMVKNCLDELGFTLARLSVVADISEPGQAETELPDTELSELKQESPSEEESLDEDWVDVTPEDAARASLEGEAITLCQYIREVLRKFENTWNGAAQRLAERELMENWQSWITRLGLLREQLNQSGYTSTLQGVDACINHLINSYVVKRPQFAPGSRYLDQGQDWA